MGNVNDLHELQTRSVFRGHTVPLAPTADARRLFAPTAGTQCLSRLRRTHGVFSCLRRPLRKQTAKSLLSAPYGKALQRQAKIFIQAKITVPPHVRNRRIKHSKSLTLGIPRVRDLLCFILLFLTCGGTVIFACMKIFACLCRAFPYGAESKLFAVCFLRGRRRHEKTPCVRRRRERHCVPAVGAKRRRASAVGARGTVCPRKTLRVCSSWRSLTFPIPCFILKTTKESNGSMVQTTRGFDEKGNKCESCTIPLL